MIGCLDNCRFTGVSNKVDSKSILLMHSSGFSLVVYIIQNLLTTPTAAFKPPLRVNFKSLAFSQLEEKC